MVPRGTVAWGPIAIGRVSWLILLLLASSSGVLGCDVWGNCWACTVTPIVRQALQNKDGILQLLQTRKCEEWRDLQFRAVVLRGQHFVRCVTFDGNAYPAGQYSTCEKAEEIKIHIDEDIAANATTNTTKYLAKDGQFECEPDGTMLFNRGNHSFVDLHDLHEPHEFIPHQLDWPDDAVVVGFQVFGHGHLVNRDCDVVCTHMCYDVESQFLLLYDIVEKNGTSILPALSSFG